MATFERQMVRWGITVDGPALSFADVFDGPGDVVLDIGFGSGDALIEMAELRPAEHVVGIDVHTPGIAAVLTEIERRGLRNVRVVEGDALDFLGRVPHGSLAAIRVFFPDPWPKQRQRQRRLIRPGIVAELTSRLRAGGVLHLATDDADYAEQMQRVCDVEPSLSGGLVERPSWRPVTRYEQRAIDEGRHPVDLVYTTSDSSPSASSSA